VLGLRVALWLWAACLSSAAQADTPTAQPNAAAAPKGVVQVVSGILGYTRWPGDSPAVRLCTLGVGAGVDELQRSPELSAGQRSVSVRTASGLPQPWRSCDALYLGTLDAEAVRSLLHEMVGRPVLVLGEGTAFCSDGGMFCLEPRTAAVRFHANLDAIARSGLRVNPLVLRIARANGGGS
jgi:hypothetical protein